MGDKIKGLVLLAIVAAAGWQGYKRFIGTNETHRFAFAVEGPRDCRVQLEYGLGDNRRHDEQSMPWEGEGSESHGNPTVLLRSRAPLSCGLQPEQMHCLVTRDGAPWKDAVAYRTTNPTNGDPAGIQCLVERDANLAGD